MVLPTKVMGATVATAATANRRSSTDSGSETYTIGMVDSLTGSLAPYGERNTRGRELALAAINEVGDRLRRGVSQQDDQSTSQGGVNGAQVLVNQDGVPLLIGSVGSGVSIAIHDSVTRDAGVVQISQNSTSPELTTRPELLRMSPSGSAKGQALAQPRQRRRPRVRRAGRGSTTITGQSVGEAFTFESSTAPSPTTNRTTRVSRRTAVHLRDG